MKATYLELRDAVSVECLLVDVGGKAKRIEEPGWGNNAKLIFVSHLDGRSAGGTLSGSEGSSRAEKGGDEGELHGVGYARKLSQGKIVCLKLEFQKTFLH
jgi:hypothetical protein